MLIRRLWIRCTALLAVATPLVAQSAWTRLTPATEPPPVCCAGMAYDSARSEIVMFGGASTAGALIDDTWIWDGTDWTLRTPATAPSPRNGHAMVEDRARGRIVLFGGVNDRNRVTDETWEWDGTDWLQRLPANRPPKRYYHAMAYDLARQRVVLFGGTDIWGLSDTWEWDGTDWHEAQPRNRPSGRSSHAMAYHIGSGGVVLYGGQAGSGQTWVWDGTDWIFRTPPQTPGNQDGHSMCHDVTRDVITLYGKYGTGTWEWNGSTWFQRQPPVAPFNRVAAPMAYDLARQRTVMFGGLLAVSIAETWVYDTQSTATFTTSGAGCAGLEGTPALAAARGTLPWIDDTLLVRLDDVSPRSPAALLIGGSNTIWRGTPLPLPLAPFGMPGCQLYVSPDATVPMALTSGEMQTAIPIANNTGLIGQRVFFQGTSLDGTANPLGVVVSDAGNALLSMR